MFNKYVFLFLWMCYVTASYQEDIYLGGFPMLDRIWYFPGVTVEILSALISTSQLESHRVVDYAGDACAQFEYFKVHSF